MRNYLLLIPAIIFCIQVASITLSEGDDLVSQGSLSSIPDFSLPSLDIAGITVTQNDISYQDIRIINFFASWCGPCKAEHPFLMELENANVDMLGIAFQDQGENAINFLNETGNPYLLTALDKNGTLGPDWEISSIPQTFIVDENGSILFHKSGRLEREDLNQNILPLLGRKNK